MSCYFLKIKKCVLCCLQYVRKNVPPGAETTLERERPRTLQDCIVQPKRLRTTVCVLVFTVPLMCYGLLLWASRDGMDVESMKLPKRLPADNKGNETLIVKKIVDTQGRYNTYKGHQIAPPVPEGEKQLVNATMWQAYLDFKDSMLQLFNTTKKTRGIVKKTVYTYSWKSTSPTITTTKRLSGTCDNNENNNENVNVSLKLSDINEDLEKIYPMVNKGGFYKPSDCWSRHKIAIIVPYRDRAENLKVFLYNIHPFLIAQKLEYQIFVIEQYADSKFNRGRLCNAGFKESKKRGPWHCVIFHDVDLLPLSHRILYNCPVYPRYMSSSVFFPNGTDKHIVVTNQFGAVSAVTTEHYEKVNGHSNIFWHYGAEQLDIFIRFVYAKIPLVRNHKDISRFVELPHGIQRTKSNIGLRALLQNAGERSKYEGLSTLEYTVRKSIVHHLYTHIVVDIDPYALDRPMQPPYSLNTTVSSTLLASW